MTAHAEHFLILGGAIAAAAIGSALLGDLCAVAVGAVRRWRR